MAPPSQPSRAPREWRWALLLVGALLPGLAACDLLPFGSQDPVATSMEVVAGEGQSAPVTEVVPATLRVRVLDQRGYPSPGAEVVFETLSDGGEVENGRVAADGEGRASPGRWRLGPRAGEQRVRARLAGASPASDSDGSVTITANALPGPFHRLVREAPEVREGRVGEPAPELPAVRALDPWENAVPGVAVTFRLVEGEGSLGTEEAELTVESDGEGRAELPEWILGPSPGVALVEARADASGGENGSAAPPIHFEAILRAGPPKAMEPLGPPILAAPQGGAPPEHPGVRVTDRFGNGVEGAEVRFRVTEGGGTLERGEARTDSLGRASAGVWTLGPEPGRNVVEARVGESDVRPVIFEAVAGAGPPATLEAISPTLQGGEVGTGVAQPPTVRLLDADGFPVSGLRVAFTVPAGGGTVEPSEVETGSGGTAAAKEWVPGGESGVHRVEARVADHPDLGPAVFEVEASPGPPETLTVVSGDGQQALVGSEVPHPPRVRARDAHGNPVGETGVSFQVVGGGGSVLGANATTSGSGIASPASWTLGPDPGENRLRASVEGIGTVTVHATGVEVDPDGFDLVVDGFSIVQVSQTSGGGVPLVRDREGLLRVRVRATEENAESPPMRVRLYRNGSLVGTETVAASFAAGVPIGVDEGALASTYNFPLPASAIQPGLGVVVEVDPDGTVPVADPSDNIYPRSGSPAGLDVRSPPPLEVTFVPVRQSANDLQGEVTPASAGNYLDLALRLFPVSSHSATVRQPYTTDAPVLQPDDGNDAWVTVLSEVNALRAAEGGTGHYYGVVRTEYSSGIAGVGYVPGSPASSYRTALGWDRFPSAPRVMAHELGHTFGRSHAPCGVSGSTDPSYPHPDARLGAHGWDATTGQLRHADTNRDLMSYCTPAWISDYTYRAILEWRGAPAYASDAGSPTAMGSVGEAPGPGGILVWGRMNDREVVVEPVFPVRAPASLPEPGPHRIRGLDGGGAVLFDHSFQGVPVAHGRPSEQHFAFALPVTEVDRERLERIEVVTADGRSRSREGTDARIALEAPGATEPVLEARRHPSDATELTWDTGPFPMALVRDPESGEILSFARSGRVTVPARGRELEVLLSDGTRAVERRVRVP